VAMPRPLSDAITIMQESGGYSFTATVDAGSSTITTSGDFQAPNRVAQTVSRTGSTPVAMVLDGGTVHVRSSDRPVVHEVIDQGGVRRPAQHLRRSHGPDIDEAGR